MRMSLLGFATLLLAIVSCKDQQQPPVGGAPSTADSADQVFLGMHTILTTKGVQRADLVADTAFVFEEGTRFDLRKPHVVFTTETGAPQGTMEGNRGMYTTRNQILEGWGNVVVHTVDGRSLTTPHVVYNQNTHLITSDTTYTIQRGSDVQKGVGFTSNQSFTQFSCLAKCTGSTSVLLPQR